MVPKPSLTVALAVLLSGPVAGVAAAPDYAVRSFEVECPGRCTPIWGDVDGDGRLDILVWNGKLLHLFAGWEDGPEGGEIALPPGARLFDLGDVNGDGTDEVLYLSDEGVWAFRLEEGRPSEPWLVLPAECDLAGQFVGPSLLAPDLDRDGLDEVWFLEARELRVYDQTTPGRFVARPALPIPSPAERLEPEEAPYRIDRMDVDGDGEEDLLAITPDGLHLFRGNAGRFDAESGWHLPLARYMEEKNARDVVDVPLEEISCIEDVTGDGFADLFLSSWSRGHVYLFLGCDGFFECEPAQTFEVGAVVTGIGTAAWEGFEGRGLVISRFVMPGLVGKVSAFFRAITGRAVTVRLSFFLFEPQEASGRPYHPDPARVREIPIRARKGDEKTSAPHRMFHAMGHDLNGDDWNDLVTLRDSTTVAFYWAGEPEEFSGKRGKGLASVFAEDVADTLTMAQFFDWSHRLILDQVEFRDPDLEVPIPSLGGYVVGRKRILDLNGDGISDLLLTCLPVRESGKSKFLLLLSRSSDPEG